MRARISSSSYEPSGTFPNQYTNAANHVFVPSFDPGLGVMLSLVDENQLETTWKYDGFGRRIRELRPDGTETVRTLVRAKDGGPKRDEWNVKIPTTTTGAEASFELPAGAAFGQRNPELLQRVKRSLLDELGDPEQSYSVGDVVQFPTPGGEASYAGVVRELGPDWLLFDFNHPLAGRPVVFEVQLIGVL